MGIFDFSTFLKKELSDIGDTGTGDISTQWIDMNSVLHTVRSRVSYIGKKKSGRVGAKSFNAYMEDYKSELDEQLSLIIRPEISMLGIFVDGVVPNAKIVEQRKRRYMNEEVGKTGAKLNCSSVAITPGTEMMMKIHGYIDLFITNKLGKICNKEKITVIYSSHLEPGEGEHKMMDEMKRRIEYLKKCTGKHLVVGNDNDFFLILPMLRINNIVLERRFETNTIIVSIDKYKNELSNRFYGLGRERLDDYCVLFSFLGNDFIPRSPALEYSFSFPSLLKAYQKNIVENGSRLVEYKEGDKDSLPEEKITFNWSSIFLLLSSFISSEETREKILIPLGLTKKKIENKRYFAEITLEDDLCVAASSLTGEFNIGIYKALWYRRALGPREGPSEELSRYTRNRLENMVYEYMRGIMWTFCYYSEGMDNVNTSWYYPYDYAPLLEELVIIGNNFNGSEIMKSIVDRENMMRPTILENLFLVIPPWYSGLIPSKLRWIMGINEELPSQIKDLFPKSIIVDSSVAGGIKRSPSTTFDHKMRHVALTGRIDIERVRDMLAKCIFHLTGHSANKEDKSRKKSMEKVLREISEMEDEIVENTVYEVDFSKRLEKKLKIVKKPGYRDSDIVPILGKTKLSEYRYRGKFIYMCKNKNSRKEDTDLIYNSPDLEEISEIKRRAVRRRILGGENRRDISGHGEMMDIIYEYNSWEHYPRSIPNRELLVTLEKERRSEQSDGIYQHKSYKKKNVSFRGIWDNK